MKIGTDSVNGTGDRRPWWPLPLLLVSIAVTAFAGLQAHNAMRNNARVAQKLLQEYAGFAAWSYQQHAGQSLDMASVMVLGPYSQSQHPYHNGVQSHLGTPPTVRDVARLLRTNETRCQCKAPLHGDSYFAMTLGVDTIATDGASLPAMLQRFIRDTVTSDARSLYATERFRWIIAGTSERPVWFAYTLMPRVAGDTIVYGFIPAPSSVRSLFAKTLASELLLPAQVTAGRRNVDIMNVAVYLPHSRMVVFASRAIRNRDFATDTLPQRFGRLAVSASIDPQAAGNLIIGGLPRSRLGILIGLLILSALLSVVAVVQIRREGQLARLRSDFVSSVSHELRTPLAQIRLFTETIRLGRATRPEDRNWALASIERETQRLSNLVDNILHFTRRGSGPLSTRVVDLAPEIREIVSSFERLAEAREMSVATDLEPQVYARANTEAIRQLLLNLLDNAVKYGRPGQTIHVVLRLVQERVRIAVTDEGPGVTRDERESIWQPFYRGDSQSVRATGGSGIGLAIVREIAMRHDGKAWVEDSPSGGASFVVEFPAVEAPAMTLAPSPRV